ncbi:phage baseplate assembly protein V [Caballeronia cordobensis]|uniref:Phage baseplate assembly protein V n=1 Tax=Caballeronia cordobensis TaxID=1353886 RepID=A0A158FM81_CABCO|nr:phage baseplate assembly protein V [Caballeronia cordobensis]SAL20797.1 phage baseplate assembly protein V [Caballeronia cordobensis]
MAGPITRRIQNMLARGTVALANASTKMQSLQLNLLADETADNVEHFEPYGFTSRPRAGAEAVAVFLDGDRSHGITVVVADRRYRLTGLGDGDVALHDDKGQSIVLGADGITITGNVKVIGALQATEGISGADGMTITGNVNITGDATIGGKSFLGHKNGGLSLD